MLQSRLCPALVAALLGLTLLPLAALAQTDQAVFQVSGIAVDATAKDAVTARTQALLQGKRQGLDRLLHRLVPAAEQTGLPAVADLNIERYVQNYEIASEQLSTTRYLAQMTVRYDPDAVRELLQTSSLSFAQVRSAPIVVLPLYDGPDGQHLWPDGNPWWQAWEKNLDPERLLRLVLPLGDLEDMASLKVEQLQARDPTALAALTGRYGSEDALVVTAKVLAPAASADHPAADTPPAAATAAAATPADTTSSAAPPAVQLTMERIGRVDQLNPPETVHARPGQTLEDLLGEAVRGLQNSLDERWKSANLLRFDQAGLMVVDIPITALSDWVGINKGLESLPEVSQVEIATFARDNVRAQIRYIGDQFRLEQALARLGLALSREGDSWLLRPTGANPSQGEPPSATSTSF
jgi:Uncharacterized protein conserved in bacteria (DUF2066)